MNFSKCGVLLFSIGWFIGVNAQSTKINGFVVNHDQLAWAIDETSNVFNNVNELSIDYREGIIAKVFNPKIWEHITRPRPRITFHAVVDGLAQTIKCNLEVDKEAEEIYLENCFSNEDSFNDLTIGWFIGVNAQSTKINGFVVNHDKLAWAVDETSNVFNNVNELSIDYQEGTIVKVFNPKIWEHITRPRPRITFLAVVYGLAKTIKCNLEVDKEAEEIYLENCFSNEDSFHDITINFSLLKL